MKRYGLCKTMESVMQYWLMKSEPGEYSFDDLLKDGQTMWDGVRNYQAQNNMRQMKQDDRVLIYHSVSEKQVVGVAEVCREAYPDPAEPEGSRWILVDVRPIKKLPTPVTLATIRATPALANIALVKQVRLSVMSLEKEAFETLLSLGGLMPQDISS